MYEDGALGNSWKELDDGLGEALNQLTSIGPKVSTQRETQWDKAEVSFFFFFWHRKWRTVQ